MAQTRLGNEVVFTNGDLPRTGTIAPPFTLTGTDLKDISLSDLTDGKLILNTFPSIDTGVCAASVREFNRRISARPGIVVLCISSDLPFAHSRFCDAWNTRDVLLLSDFRYREFGEMYGLRLLNGPFAGLLSRAVIVVDADKRVSYTQLVPSIDIEPDYESVFHHLTP